MNTEYISKISSITECDINGLSLILSFGFDTINNYEEACAELKNKQKLAAHFSDRVKRVGAKSHFPTDFDLNQLEMTKEELGAEVVKRIGYNDGFNKFWYGPHSLANCSRENVKKLVDIFTQEVTDCKTRYDKANIALEKNKDAIMLIPPDYRYPLALSTMLGFVRNLKATTWKECVNLYDEQLYRWQMLENSAENIRINREIRALTKRAADSATAAAIFSGLNFLLK